MRDAAMRRQPRDETIPRILLRAMFGLVAFSFVAVLIGQNTGVGLRLTPEAAPVERRMIAFEDRDDGSTVVRDHETGAKVALLEPGGDGFVRGVLRGLTRDRALTRMEETNVYLLTAWDDGRLSIEDPATGQRFDLNSFGVDNLEAFARFLKSREDDQT